MSEYQYYEFQAIDRPLNEREIAKVRRLSSRASITSRSFTNEYHWGDFRGNPSKLVESYYDAFLYLSNWGTNELSLRLPKSRLDLATAKRYAPGQAASARAKGDYVILELTSQSEDGGDDEDDAHGLLAGIVPVRAEIARGDHRALYLGWLLEVQEGDLDDDAPEPPCPPGLGELSAPLDALADFLRIDRRLIEVAAKESGPAPRRSSRAVASEIAAWPARRKDALLGRPARGEDPASVQEEVLRHLTKSQPAESPRSSPPRTAGQFREAAQLAVSS